MMLVASASARAQYYSPVVAQLPASTRWLAMGNTAIASRDDDVLFYNPAQLVIARGISMSGERLSPSASIATISSVTRFNTGGVAVGATMAGYDVDGTLGLNRESMLTGGPHRAGSFNAVLGVAQLIKGFRTGAAVKYAEDHVSDERHGRAMIDVGVSRDFRQFFTAGLAVQNIGKSTTEDFISPGGPIPSKLPSSVVVATPLTTTLGVAAARPLGVYDVTATAAVSMLRADYVAPSGGVEVSYSWLDGYAVAIRGGARRPDYGEGRWTTGAGLTVDRLSIDYALETLTRDRIGHRIGLRLR
jgi:hypothetical protein